MKRLSIIVVALCLALPVVCAEAKVRLSTQPTAGPGREDLDFRAQYDRYWLGHKGDPGSCAPDRPEPIWGPGNALLGYSCMPYGG